MLQTCVAEWPSKPVTSPVLLIHNLMSIYLESNEGSSCQLGCAPLYYLRGTGMQYTELQKIRHIQSRCVGLREFEAVESIRMMTG